MKQNCKGGKASWNMDVQRWFQTCREYVYMTMVICFYTLGIVFFFSDHS